MTTALTPGFMDLMNAQATRYIRRAHALKRKADEASDLLEKRALLVLAAAWVKIAENESSLTDR